MNYKSFIIKDRLRWNAYILRSIEYETYHTWCYHSLNKQGEPLMFVHEEDDKFIALPLVKRRIGNSSLYDLTSVYGYSGPVSNFRLDDVEASVKRNFELSFKHFMSKEHCVCVFTRLHPFMNQHYLLEGLGGIRNNGYTIYMDLTQKLNDQIDRYEKRLSRQIRSLRKKGYFIKEAMHEDEVKSFTRMYHENMDRLSASEHYYYDHTYFSGLLNIPGFNNKLILVYDGDTLICGALILISNNLIRNHLSATAAAYLKDSPSKLLTDEISLIGREFGAKVFHLGGGVGGREDSLFNFKRFFSDMLLPDRTWCYTHDDTAYHDLVAARKSEIDLKSSFFPMYRQNFNTKSSDVHIAEGVTEQLK